MSNDTPLSTSSVKCEICDGTWQVNPFHTEDPEWHDPPKHMCVFCWAEAMAGDDDGILDRQVRNGAVTMPKGWPYRDHLGRFRIPRDHAR